MNKEHRGNNIGTVKMKKKVPMCDICITLMTEVVGWAWHTCPDCGNSVRIIDGEVKWQKEIFGKQSATYGGRRCEYIRRDIS